MDKKTGDGGQQAAWLISKPLSTGAELPIGTGTFLFTDILRSTPLGKTHPGLMAEALEIHTRALREAVNAHEPCSPDHAGSPG